MNIVNKDAYANSIYRAIVLNVNIEQDPSQDHRVQIYIPATQYEFDNIYEDYMKEYDKTTSQHFGKFPWAKTLVELDDLKEGCFVYGSYINDKFDEFIILGVDETEPTNYEYNNMGSIDYSISGNSEVLNLALAIIISNEIGIEPNQWPSGINDSMYTKITPSDNDTGWSIGLIQWHHTRAFDLLMNISFQVPNWTDYWLDKSYDLFNDLQSQNTKAKVNYQSNFRPQPGTPLYESIKGMLGSDGGKIVQREYAATAISNSLNILKTQYSINNPLVLIYLADLMNQYGNGIVSTFSLSYCAQLANYGDDYVQGLDKVIAYAKSNIGSYSTYKSRREKTEAYCKSMETLQTANVTLCGGLTSVTSNSATTAQDFIVSGEFVPGNGQYEMPYIGTATVTATFGSNGYRNNVRLNPHPGVDFSMPRGTPIRAVTDGHIEMLVKTSGSTNSGSDGGYSYGTYIQQKAADGNVILYCHLSEHVGESRDVVRGEIIGLSGNTGNSSGPHLHFEIRSGGCVQNPFAYIGMDSANGGYATYDHRYTAN